MAIRKVSIVTIGDELLIGQTLDTNSAWMGQQLTQAGVSVTERATIADTKADIISTVRRLLPLSDLILMTGGLGPTRDDVTKVALAELAGVPMVFDEEMWQDIQAYFDQLGRSTTAAHREQCFMPDRILKLENKMGTAPGMLFDLDGKLLVAMPGVPYEMRYIMEHGVLPLVREHSAGAIVHRTLLTVGAGESSIAEQIEDIIASMPPELSLAFLPSIGSVRLRLTAKGEREAALSPMVDDYAQQIHQRLGRIIYAEGDISLAEVVGQLCRERNLMIATAESCTGGRAASKIVAIAGSSDYYEGSIVSYTNQLKHQILGVKATTLADYGAVSKETVTEMVSGVLEVLTADLAVAISGIAGPTGGSPAKPVGMIWLAVGNADQIETQCIRGSKDRGKNIEYAATIALDMIRRFVLDHY